jgi:hypothetical protein
MTTQPVAIAAQGISSTPKPVQITITPASAKTGVTTPVVLTQMAATTETTAPQVVSSQQTPCTDGHNCPGDELLQTTDVCTDGHNCPGDEPPTGVCLDGHNCPGDEPPTGVCTDGHNCPGDGGDEVDGTPPGVCKDGHNCPGDENPAQGICKDGHNCPGDENPPQGVCKDGHNCPGDENPPQGVCKDGHNCPGDENPASEISPTQSGVGVDGQNCPADENVSETTNSTQIGILENPATLATDSAITNSDLLSGVPMIDPVTASIPTQLTSHDPEPVTEPMDISGTDVSALQQMQEPLANINPTLPADIMQPTEDQSHISLPTQEEALAVTQALALVQDQALAGAQGQALDLPHADQAVLPDQLMAQPEQPKMDSEPKEEMMDTSGSQLSAVTSDAMSLDLVPPSQSILPQISNSIDSGNL